MGLFSKKKSKTLNEVLFLNEFPFAELEYQEINRESEFVDYEADLPTSYLTLFDAVQLRIWNDELKIDRASQIHATFKIYNEELTMEKLIAITNMFADEWGKDTTGSAKWNETDNNMIAGDYWTGRTYRFNDNAELNSNGFVELRLSYDPEYGDGCELHIMSLNKLL